MKTILFLTAILCLGLSATNLTTPKTKNISGTILDPDREPIIGANIFIHGTKKGTISDSSGMFNMVIPFEVTRLSISHFAFEQQTIEINDHRNFEITLTKRDDLNKINNTLSGEDEPVRLRGYPTLGKKEAPMSERPPEILRAPSSKAKMMHDDSFSEGITMTDMHVAEAESTTSPDAGKARGEGRQVTKAGQLTAGEWNDLNNWEAWNTLINEADYKEMGQYWGLNSSDRMSVFVTNQYELPIADCLVTLTENGKIVWTSKTDNSGKAELWVKEGQENLEITVKSKENKQKLSTLKRIKDGVNKVQFKEECDAPRKAEIMFVVDATGSMGDEIEFLKSELSDVIDQVEASRSDVNFSWGSVFYRDGSDEYLTRQSPLTSKTKRVLDFIDMQSAGGGGDYPEAVNEGLEEALMQEWSDEAIARIVFLVLDAPPHHDPEVLKDLQSQIAFASAMGIKIIPITASGINRQTEYLMKFMSIMTNGTYVFLTDHSGIGNAHLDPVVKNFEVEKLNDLLVRVIRNYTDPGRCTNQEDNDPIFANIEVFPNPTVDLLQVKVPNGIEKITLTTSSGMLVHSEMISEECDVSLDLTSYVDGMYVVNFYSTDKVYSVKVIKSNKA